MKRRNVESSAGKLRRAAKRSKISDGYSYLCNLKFLLVWALVIILDFVADFRFELLYPFWVFFSNVSETFKFKGISYLFSYVFITITIDMICYYLIPVHWLFFASSTYVWLQFTWYSERGLTLFSIFIWMFFICVEAFVRLRELKNLPIQFEICKPFAAHGIGYPIITLGVGCKSYVHYRLRLHTKRIVAKENEFYYSLLQKALVPELLTDQNGSGGSEALEYATANALNSATTKYLPSSASSLTPSSPLGGKEAVAAEFSSATASATKSHPISVHSNGTASVSRLASGSSRVASSSSSNSSETIDGPPSGRHWKGGSRVGSLFGWLGSLFIFELHLSTRISKCLASSVNSIHYVTSKVLSSVTFARAHSTSSQTSSTVNSQSTSGSECTVANGKKRRGSIVNEGPTRLSSEEVPADVSTGGGTSQATTAKSTRQPNGSISKGKGNGEASETLKKSNPPKTFDLPKSTVTEASHQKSANCNGSSSTLTVSTSSSSESICKKTNISNNSNATVPDGKVAAASSGGSKSNEVILNGNCGGGGGGNKTHKSASNSDSSLTASTVELNTAVNGHLQSTSTSKNTKKNKRSSLEDPRNLMELIKNKDDQLWKLENDNQRLKAELQTIRQCESDLRQQLTSYAAVEKSLKASITGFQSEIEHLQKKVQTAQQNKQQDKQNIQRLEKLLEDEKRKAKTSSEMHAASEKKARMAEECAARANAMAEAVKNVCSESCRQRQREIELDIASARKEMFAKEEQLRMKDAMLDEAKDLKDKVNMLMSALSAMHDKNSQLEESLNMEKMLKLDLYAHLEDYKQQISKQRVMSMNQDKQIRELKQKLSMYTGNAQNSYNSVMTSTGLNLNGFNSSSVNSSGNDIDLVNRCFSSCSPNAAASPSSLSSGTPPLPNVGQSLMDCSNSSRKLCNVSPVAPIAAPSVSNSSSFMLGSMRDYSLDSCLNSGWPSSLKSPLSASSSPSDILSSGNATSNGTVSKAPGAPLSGGNGGGGGGGGSGQKLSDFESANKSTTPNLSFTNRFDI